MNKLIFISLFIVGTIVSNLFGINNSEYLIEQGHIEKLPEDLKMAITLREIEGMSYEEIASVMDCPVGTVRSRIFRAREAIDKEIQPLLDAH